MRSRYRCTKTSLDGRLPAGGLRIRSANSYLEALGKQNNTNERVEPLLQTTLRRTLEHLIRKQNIYGSTSVSFHILVQLPV